MKFVLKLKKKTKNKSSKKGDLDLESMVQENAGPRSSPGYFARVLPGPYLGPVWAGLGRTTWDLTQM